MAKTQPKRFALYGKRWGRWTDQHEAGGDFDKFLQRNFGADLEMIGRVSEKTRTDDAPGFKMEVKEAHSPRTSCSEWVSMPREKT